jgi:NarL family two-component system sensor histidine kinase LiaS
MANAERIRLAQQLHDGIAQDLVGVGYSLDLLLAAPQTPIDTRIQLRTLRFMIADMVEKVRQEMFQLRQPTGLTLSQQIEILFYLSSSLRYRWRLILNPLTKS